MTNRPPSVEHPLFRPVGERAVLVEFAEEITEDAHRAVLALDDALSQQPFVGYCEAVPAFVNLLVVFDPFVTDHARVQSHLKALLKADTIARRPGRQHTVDVCYDGPDLERVASLTGLTQHEVISRHMAGSYSVYLYGFAPGYAYLGGVVPELRINRKEAPVRGLIQCADGQQPINPCHQQFAVGGGIRRRGGFGQ